MFVFAAVGRNGRYRLMARITERSILRRGTKPLIGAALAAAMVGGVLIAPASAQAASTCDGRTATIVGTNAADNLVGTEGSDVIVGLGGNDTILGLDGDDIICGGDGNDLIRAGRGEDRIFGEAGNDVIRGQQSADTIVGGTGNDTIRGNNGADTIDGEDGDDTLLGGKGRDVINGGVGADEIGGGNHDDIIFGDAGDDVLRGGNGADVINSGLGNDNIRGGIGVDQIFRDGSSGDEINTGDGNDFIDGAPEDADVGADQAPASPAAPAPSPSPLPTIDPEDVENIESAPVNEDGFEPGSGTPDFDAALAQLGLNSPCDILTEQELSAFVDREARQAGVFAQLPAGIGTDSDLVFAVASESQTSCDWFSDPFIWFVSISWEAADPTFVETIFAGRTTFGDGYMAALSDDTAGQLVVGDLLLRVTNLIPGNTQMTADRAVTQALVIEIGNRLSR